MAILNINAANFSAQLNANYTKDSLHNFLKSGFSACGFPAHIAETIAATNITVWDLALNPSRSRGTVRVVLETSVATTTATIRLRLHDPANYNAVTFTAATNTGANNTTGATFTTSTLLPLLRYAIPNNQEIFGLCLVEGGAFRGFLGLSYVANYEAWFDENVFIRAGLIQPTTPNGWWSPVPNPLSTTTTTTATISVAQLGNFFARNPINGDLQIIKSPYVTGHAGAWGITCQFNSDWGIVNGNGYNTGDILVVTPGGEEYWILWPGSASANGIAVRSI